MQNKTPVVENGKLFDAGGRFVCDVATSETTSRSWVQWLKNPANRSFRFGGFLAVHQTRKSESNPDIVWEYWYLQARYRGRVWHRSLGPVRNAEAITVQKLALVADKLSKHLSRVDFREAPIPKQDRDDWRNVLRQRPKGRRPSAGDESSEPEAGEQLALFEEPEGRPGLGDYGG